MTYLYDDDGNFVGKFNFSKASRVAHNKQLNDTRWSAIFQTASGKYVFSHQTLWQGEYNTYRPISKTEVIELMEKWGYIEKRICDEFPGYKEEETY